MSVSSAMPKPLMSAKAEMPPIRFPVSRLVVVFSQIVGFPKTRIPPVHAVSVVRVLMVTLVPMMVWMPVVTLIAVIIVWPEVPSTITIAKTIARTTYAK